MCDVEELDCYLYSTLLNSTVGLCQTCKTCRYHYTDWLGLVIQIQKECKLEIDVEEYADSFKPFLMDVLYNWSKVDVSLAIFNLCFSTSNFG
jgi:hypothetical protein